jgi:hypothetical protein
MAAVVQLLQAASHTASPPKASFALTEHGVVHQEDGTVRHIVIKLL